MLLLGSASVAYAVDNEQQVLADGREQLFDPVQEAVTISAWDQVYHLWLAWLQADPAERLQAAQRLNVALQELERAWQSDQDEPFFYAIDTATRMKA